MAMLNNQRVQHVYKLETLDNMKASIDKIWICDDLCGISTLGNHKMGMSS